jgi:bifunctional enzyme CysN/CysC
LHPVADQKSTNITRIEHRIPVEAREARNGHRGGVLWFTGLSGAGKSTLAFALEEELFRRGFQVYVIDGDNLRYGLNSDLGFSHEDRTENIRRAGEVAALFARAGAICISAFVSPYRADRDVARKAAGDRFNEVYVKADLATCERRDPKGLYKKARRGEIQDFTGVSAPYEAPLAPEIVVDTAHHTVAECVTQLLEFIDERLTTSSTKPDTPNGAASTASKRQPRP